MNLPDYFGNQTLLKDVNFMENVAEDFLKILYNIMGVKYWSIIPLVLTFVNINNEK